MRSEGKEVEKGKKKEVVASSSLLFVSLFSLLK